MPDPFALAVATAIATAAAGKTAESMTVQSQQAVRAIIARIRHRFRRHPDRIAALDAAVADDAASGELSLALEREFAADPAFRDEVKSLWRQAAPVAADSTVSNVLYGHADKIVQLRDVHGNLDIS
jgi:hypothetical protein